MSSTITGCDQSISLSELRQAVGAGVIDEASLARLLAWRRTPHVDDAAAQDSESPKSLNAIMVAYYFGALLMISACAWFLGDKWQDLGTRGILLTALIYFAITLGAGSLLRRHGYRIAGGLLITVAVSLIALIAYCVEDLLGLWPAATPGRYANYYPYINGSWIGMELATMAAAAIALYFVRFAFLTAPFAFSAWFLSMDMWALLRDKQVLDWSDRCRVSIVVGLAILLCGFALDRLRERRPALRSEDLAFWCYLFGLLAFWGGLTSMNSDSEVGKFFYALINLGLIGVAIGLRRGTFLVFGAIGFYIYLGHLAYAVFKDSVLFPFALALLGLATVFAAVFVQRQALRRATPA